MAADEAAQLDLEGDLAAHLASPNLSSAMDVGITTEQPQQTKRELDTKVAVANKKSPSPAAQRGPPQADV